MAIALLQFPHDPRSRAQVPPVDHAAVKAAAAAVKENYPKAAREIMRVSDLASERPGRWAHLMESEFRALYAERDALPEILRGPLEDAMSRMQEALESDRRRILKKNAAINRVRAQAFPDYGR
jgi:hypothetical protein